MVGCRMRAAGRRAADKDAADLPPLRLARPTGREREDMQALPALFLNDENRSNFRKTRGKLCSNMRKIDGTERTSPSKASASVSSTTVKTPWRTRGRVMFFLIRTAFWLSIVIVLLPTPESMKTPEPGIGAAQAVTAASATVSDMSQFCSRQPEACQIGSQALTYFGYKAQASAKWVYEKFTSKTEQPGTAAPAKAIVETDSQNTLTHADTAPAW